MSYDYGVLIAILLAGMFITVRAGKLTVSAAITGGLVGLLVFIGASYTGVVMMAAFFIIATVATSWRINEKTQSGLAENNKGRRTTGQVIANSGVAGLLGLLVWLYPQHANVFRLMIAASLAAATSDTLSSELGNIYGRRFYNIVTLKKDIRGLDGVISLEGSIAGVIGSSAIALIYAAGFGWNKHIIIIIVAGTIGNISDSILGATLERSRYLNNDVVNFLNTLIAALAALIIHLFVLK